MGISVKRVVFHDNDLMNVVLSLFKDIVEDDTPITAIDGYVNVVGSRVDSQWEYIDEASAPIKERLIRIYKNLNRPLDLNRGIWEDVLLIFSLREDINRYELASIYGMQEAVVPAIFKVIEQKYPIRLTHAIAEGAIELLLNISE